LSKSFVLLRDVDVSAYVGPDAFMIGKSPNGGYHGTFDGAGHVVSNFTYADTSQSVGLFASVYGGTVKNLTVTNANVVGESVGALAGIASDASFIDCHASGTVQGSNTGGGLVGYLTGGSIERSSSSVAVTMSGYIAGGLVAQVDSNATISNSYATGAVAAIGGIGGLAGNADYVVVITSSYSTGLVGGSVLKGGLVGFSSSGAVTVTDSFWDTDTSGQTTSAGGGIGQPTALMKTPSTFLDAGWSTSTWKIVEGEYPTLMP
jgi:hypothetical protein